MSVGKKKTLDFKYMTKYEFGEVAPMVERLVEAQGVTGSSPVLSTMTATVLDSPCRYCLRNYNPSKCLTVCDIIIN